LFLHFQLIYKVLLYFIKIFFKSIGDEKKSLNLLKPHSIQCSIVKGKLSNVHIGMVYSGVSLLSLQQEVLNGVITWQLPTVPNVPVSIKCFVHLLH
jgi:hypothetical protein